MQVDNLLDIGKSQTEALDIVHVAGMHAVELLKHLLQIFLLDADAGISHGEAEMGIVVPCTQIDIERLLGLAILHGVVHQIEEGVLEVHLIDIDGRVDSLNLGVDFSAGMLYAQGKRVGHVLDHLVEVEVLLLEHSLLAVEHTHLQHLLHEEAQALGLVLHR